MALPTPADEQSRDLHGKWRKVCILGVGLLGGSIARGLKANNAALHISGWGRSKSKLEAAQNAGTIDSFNLQIEVAAADADLVIAATPVQQIVESLTLAAKCASENCLFVDVGSTKASIANAAKNESFSQRFCPSHPIAGSEKSGAEFASATLLHGKTVVLTPISTTSSKTVAAARALWSSLGAIVVEMEPEAHDHALAMTSHMPHMVASALSAATPSDFLSLVGSGWADTTRVAAGDPRMWRQIIEENRTDALQAMHSFATIWAKLIDAVERHDFDLIENTLLEGKHIRDAVGNRHSSCE